MSGRRPLAIVTLLTLAVLASCSSSPSGPGGEGGKILVAASVAPIVDIVKNVVGGAAHDSGGSPAGRRTV